MRAMILSSKSEEEVDVRVFIEYVCLVNERYSSVDLVLIRRWVSMV